MSVEILTDQQIGIESIVEVRQSSMVTVTGWPPKYAYPNKMFVHIQTPRPPYNTDMWFSSMFCWIVKICKFSWTEEVEGGVVHWWYWGRQEDNFYRNALWYLAKISSNSLNITIGKHNLKVCNRKGWKYVSLKNWQARPTETQFVLECTIPATEFWHFFQVFFEVPNSNKIVFGKKELLCLYFQYNSIQLRSSTFWEMMLWFLSKR